MSAHRETFGAEPFKFGEALSASWRTGNPEPSPGCIGKGVETRRGAPNPAFGRQGEGIVQTTNSAFGGSSENCSGKKILWPARAVTVQLRSGAQSDSLKDGSLFLFVDLK